MKEKKDNTIVIKKILDECYWDSALSQENICSILRSENRREKAKLFNRILNNSTDVIEALQLFSQEDLILLFDNFDSGCDKAYIYKRYLALRNILLRESDKIPGLEWKKR